MSFPRRFRSFSLRTLMVLTAVLGLLFAWIATERNTVIERREMIAKLRDNSKVLLAAPEDLRALVAKHPSPNAVHFASIGSWRELLGDVPVQSIRYSAPADRAEVERVQKLFPEASVSVWDLSSLPPVLLHPLPDGA